MDPATVTLLCVSGIPTERPRPKTEPKRLSSPPSRKTNMKAPHPEKQPHPPGPRVHRRLSSDMVHTMPRGGCYDRSVAASTLLEAAVRTPSELIDLSRDSRRASRR